MGVYIKDMEMPTSCNACELAALVDISDGIAYGCRALKEMIYNDRERLPNCPLVPVPPHGRLGDLDKLEQMFVDIDNAPYSCFDGEEPFYSAEDAAQIIRLTPTVIPAEEGE